MVPRDHGFGSSFKGVAAYLLHDKDHANTNERLAWSHVHNMGTSNPETAFRVMAATAMDQRRIKEQAHDRAQVLLPEDQRKPFRNSGRKSNEHVWHYSLSWSPEEAENLTKEEMIEAAQSSLAVLGKDQGKGHNRRQYADEHQAVFICHQDEPHPHVHVVVNRVHQDHGLMISKYKDWDRFSKWAENYEKERGQVYCQQRVANNQLRQQFAAQKQPIKVYGKGHLPHHLAPTKTADRTAANDNVSVLKQVEDKQREANAALAKRGRELAEQQRNERKTLLEQYTEQKRIAQAAFVRDKLVTRAKVYSAHQDQQTMILERQQTAMVAFEINEHDLAGKAKNIWQAVKAEWSIQNTENRKTTLSHYWKPITGEAARLEALKANFLQEQRQFEITRERALEQAEKPIIQKAQIDRENNRTEYVRQQSQLEAKQARENEALKQSWFDRKNSQKTALEVAQKVTERRKPPAPEYTPEYNKVAQGRATAEKTQQSTDSRALEREKRIQMAKAHIEKRRQEHEQQPANDREQDQGDDDIER